MSESNRSQRSVQEPRKVLRRVRRAPDELGVVLAYKNKHVIHSFMDKYALNLRTATAIFEETKKYLWLIAVARHRRLPPPFINDALLIIDEMWHSFVLFTRDYREYCRRHYGFYIDHLPTTRDDQAEVRRQMRADPGRMNSLFEAELREQLSFIYDELGRDTVNKWFVDYPKRYSRIRLEKLRRAQAQRALKERGIDGL
jgi:hypothetical protein